MRKNAQIVNAKLPDPNWGRRRPGTAGTHTRPFGLTYFAHYLPRTQPRRPTPCVPKGRTQSDYDRPRPRAVYLHAHEPKHAIWKGLAATQSGETAPEKNRTSESENEARTNKRMNRSEQRRLGAPERASTQEPPGEGADPARKRARQKAGRNRARGAIGTERGRGRDSTRERRTNKKKSDERQMPELRTATAAEQRREKQ